MTKKFPEWLPKEAVGFVESGFFDFKPIEKLLSDSRMEPVWKSIKKRVKSENDICFFLMAARQGLALSEWDRSPPA